MVTLADPVYTLVDLNNDTGYEYKGEDDNVYGPFPAVALFTWALKGMFPSTMRIRCAGRREFRPLSDFEHEIMLVARVQLTHVLLDRKEWFYLDTNGDVQGPFSPEQMISFISTRYIRESVKFYGRPVTQSHAAKPRSDALEFRPYGELLSETLSDYRENMRMWREKTYGKQNAVQNGSGGCQEESRISTEPPVSDPLPLLSPVSSRGAPSNGHLPIPRPEMTYEQLTEAYGDRLFSDDTCDWYVLFSGKIYGPIDQIKAYRQQLKADSLLALTRKGESVPAHSNFIPYEQHLRKLYSEH